jgi:hypothetical protein
VRCDVIIAGRRYVLCHNEADADKDAEARAAILAALERKLAEGERSPSLPRYSYCVFSIN